MGTFPPKGPPIEVGSIQGGEAPACGAGPAMGLDHSHAEFPPTQWTLIEALQGEDHPQHTEAVDVLAGRYWPPVYAYLRRTGKRSDEAAEVTQAFFAEVVLPRELFERADPQRGRLRTLLLTALKRFLRDRHRRRMAERGDITLSFDELGREEALLCDDPGGGVDEAFERRWAVAILETALARCEEHYRTTGREKHWAAFEAHVLRPSISMTDPRPLAEVARQVGFDTADEVAGVLRTVKKRAITLLREAAAETAIDHEDQEAEYRFVVALLS